MEISAAIPNYVLPLNAKWCAFIYTTEQRIIICQELDDPLRKDYLMFM
jgi:hypothetical protein